MIRIRSLTGWEGAVAACPGDTGASLRGRLASADPAPPPRFKLFFKVPYLAYELDAVTGRPHPCQMLANESPCPPTPLSALRVVVGNQCWLPHYS